MVARTKNPRYLVGTALGLVYLYSFMFRRFGTGHGSDAARALAAPYELAVAQVALLVLAIVAVLLTWTLGGEQTGLQFTEAEVQFLFPAPVSRSQLLNYKLARTLSRTLFSAVISTFFFRRGLNAGHPVFLLLGMMLAMTLYAFHAMGASLTRATLTQTGRAGFRRSLPFLAMAMAAGVGVAYAVTHAKLPPEIPASGLGLASWLTALTTTRPLGIALWPFRAVVAVPFAQSLPEFLRALPAPLGFLALHYLWVVRSDASFEDAALESSQRRAHSLENRRAGKRFVPTRAAKAWLRLSSAGHPAWGLTWKNLVSAQRAFGLRSLVVLLPVGAVVGAVAVQLASSLPPSGDVPLIVAGVLLAVAAFTTLFGPLMLRIDLRQDVQQLDVLRALPLSGRQVVVAELLGPTLVLGLAELGLLMAAYAITLRSPFVGMPLGMRTVVLLAGACVLPAVTAAVLFVQNGAALLFPAWMSFGPGQVRGIEAMGQRLLNLAATLLVLAVGVLPAALVGGLVYFLLAQAGLYQGAMVLGSATGSAVVWGALALGTLGLAKLYEQLDPSTE